MSSKWDQPGAGGGAAAAAAAAAKIAAQYAAAPGSSTSGNAVGTGAPRSSSSSAGASERRRNGPEEPEFLHKIEINDQRNRYMLTKGQTQQSILRETGASVTTKGTWYPDKSLATAQDPPLYLEVSAVNQETLDKGIRMIADLMKQDVPQLIEDRAAKRLEWENQARPKDTGWQGKGERRKWPEEKVFIGLESLRNFNIRAKVVGPGGLFVKYIQSETGTRVQIKGIGSGFIDLDTGRESDEPMHISISGPDENMLVEAKRLAEDLLEVVRIEYGKAQQALGFPPQQHQPYGNGPYPPQQQQQLGGYGTGPQQHYETVGYGGAQQPPLPTDGGAPPPPPQDDAPLPPPGGGSGYAGAPGGYGQRGAHDSSRQPSFTPASSSATQATPNPSSSTLPVGLSSAGSGAAATAALSPEEQALDKYWKDYITWEKSFVEYHKRLPTVEEGKQEIPPQYR
ncbi:hypothetical protein K437DRAFT_258837 [Tilletiaria anomala UBC 951]|uniref:K Homology domain-containing protein n=1 Tax=Tilletiaria anomala (strain ATCC 24038 / CBS 436.72 / UBC 951) TaxID=1037660 RepID=A0A066VI15_TILAU|nr:uncharacterized protein K437DRAFT_258837 [Tilletiaria anomala UBC 951]KDN39953.1 hypothetical protein K437DRAFT_258837 [Tilletiaria anomala UBC 951]